MDCRPASSLWPPGLFPSLPGLTGPLSRRWLPSHPPAPWPQVEDIFPEECSRVRYVIACFAPGQFYKKTTDLLCSRALRLSVGVASPRCLPGLGSPGLHPLPLPRSPRPPCVAKGALSIKTACGECMSPTEVAAPIGGGKAVPGLGCDGHLYAEGRGQRYRTHVQGLEGGVQGVEGRAGAP